LSDNQLHQTPEDLERQVHAYVPIERRKVYELVADQLVSQIGEQHLRPGDALPPERELMQRYRVGRSSVREALRMLESRGLIESVGNGSFAVAGYANPLNNSLQLLLSLDQASMHDIYELRRIVECEAAALAAERRSDAHLRLMDEAIEEMAEGLRTAGGDRYVDADLRFHLAIAEATDNGVILHAMRAVRDVIRRALVEIFPIPGTPARSLRQHRTIRSAIADGDADRARDAMRRHLLRVESDVNRNRGTGEARG
jgi:GntR family transcriptional regulator, transcriptional repressor for pyruvate dehydrogenase complex